MVLSAVLGFSPSRFHPLRVHHRQRLFRRGRNLERRHWQHFVPLLRTRFDRPRRFLPLSFVRQFGDLHGRFSHKIEVYLFPIDAHFVIRAPFLTVF